MFPPLKIFCQIPGAPSVPPVVMLYPFAGIPAEHPDDPARGRFDQYCQIAGRWFESVERRRAVVAVLPWDWHQVRDDCEIARITRQFLRANQAAGLPTLIFDLHDSEAPVREANTLVFRSSILRRQRRPNEFALPAWTADFHAGGTPRLSPRLYAEIPVVGFCGASYRQDFKVPNWFRRHFRPLRCQYERVHPHGQGLRAFVLDVLAASREVRALILERDRFYGGMLTKAGPDYACARRVRQEYFEHLLASDYVLCLRGGGNFSYRLYEALSVGRIPVFVNTDCVLPWEDLIPWRELCVWVEQAEISELGRIVAEHHCRLSPEQFAERQGRCREVWEQHLSTAGFFRTLHGWLTARLRCPTGS